MIGKVNVVKKKELISVLYLLILSLLSRAAEIDCLNICLPQTTTTVPPSPRRAIDTGCVPELEDGTFNISRSVF